MTETWRYPTTQEERDRALAENAALRAEVERLKQVEAAVVRFAEADAILLDGLTKLKYAEYATIPDADFQECRDAKRDLLRLGKEARHE